MTVKVSVIVPTYKRSEFLERAIDSVLNQTYSNIEVVVVDDNDPASPYRIETEKKMEKHSGNEKVKYVKNKKNLGGALARNEGIYNADGDYITFLDDDDIYLPKKIEVQVNYMLENCLELTFTDVRLHNEKDMLVDYREHNYIQNFSNEELLKQHLMHHLTPTATYMFKKENLINIGGFDNVQVGQEFMLMLKSIENELDIGYLPVSHVIQYLHDGDRISVGQNKLNKEVELYKFKKKYFKYLTPSQRRYVKFRHHAVMVVAGKRSSNQKVVLRHLLLVLTTSPKYCFIEMKNQIKKIKRYRKESTK